MILATDQAPARLVITSAGHNHDARGHRACRCRAIAASERAAAKQRKPAGYAWPLYNEPRKPSEERHETVAETLARQTKRGVAGYTWRLWDEGAKRRFNRKVWPRWEPAPDQAYLDKCEAEAQSEYVERLKQWAIYR